MSTGSADATERGGFPFIGDSEVVHQGRGPALPMTC